MTTSYAFKNDATGDPINLQRRIAMQTARGIPVNAAASYGEFKSNGGPVLIQPQRIARQIIEAGGKRKSGLDGKWNLGGNDFAVGDLDVNDLGFLNLLVGLVGRYAQSTIGAAYERWQIDQDQATTVSRYLSLLNDQSGLPPFRVTDLLPTSFQLGTQPNGNLLARFGWQASEFDFHAFPVEETASADTKPILKRTWLPLSAATADDDVIYVKITSSDATSVTFQAKHGDDTGDGTGTPAFSNSQTATIGEWTRLQKQDGTRFGEIAEQVYILFPTGGTYTALTVYSWNPWQSQWSPATEVDYGISSVRALVYADGDEIPVEGSFQLNTAWDQANANPQIHGKQGATPRTSGKLVSSLQLEREFVDLYLQSALLDGRAISAAVHAETKVVIPGAAVPFSFTWWAGNCEAEGDLFGVAEGGQNRNESATLFANSPSAATNHPTVSGVSTTAPFSFLLHNERGTLAG